MPNDKSNEPRPDQAAPHLAIEDKTAPCVVKRDDLGEPPAMPDGGTTSHGHEPIPDPFDPVIGGESRPVTMTSKASAGQAWLVGSKGRSGPRL